VTKICNCERTCPVVSQYVMAICMLSLMKLYKKLLRSIWSSVCYTSDLETI